jgi:hypothetical protein
LWLEKNDKTTNLSPSFFVALVGSRIRDGNNQDSGWIKIRIRDLGSGINIPDPQHWLKHKVPESLQKWRSLYLAGCQLMFSQQPPKQLFSLSLLFSIDNVSGARSSS